MYYNWDENLPVDNKINFFLLIWNKGEFQNNLIQHIQFLQPNSLVKYAKTLKNFGFLSIETKESPNSKNLENFYFVSEKNFINIFNHICRSVRIPFDENIRISLFNSKKELTSDLITDIQNDLIFDDLLDRNKINLVNKSISVFFYYIIRSCCSIVPNSAVDVFMNTIFTKLNEITAKQSV